MKLLSKFWVPLLDWWQWWVGRYMFDSENERSRDLALFKRPVGLYMSAGLTQKKNKGKETKTKPLTNVALRNGTDQEAVETVLGRKRVHGCKNLW